MKIYISGAITGTTDYLKRFKKAERKLKKYGYPVINPAKVNSKMPKDTECYEYMMMSLTMLNMADCMVLLPNSENSKGVAEEIKFAEAHNIPVLTYDKYVGARIKGVSKGCARSTT